jgi:hypothetical protein
MAFVNEKLTPDQQKEVNSWGISYHHCSMGQILKTMKLENPWVWTVDKERKIYLFGVYYLRDYYEENVFVFIWKKKQYLVQFRYSWENKNTLIWDIPEHYACNSIVFPYNTEEGFIDDLRSALVTYGKNGTADEWNKKINTKCNF